MYAIITHQFCIDGEISITASSARGGSITLPYRDSELRYDNHYRVADRLLESYCDEDMADNKIPWSLNVWNQEIFGSIMPDNSGYAFILGSDLTRKSKVSSSGITSEFKDYFENEDK